LAGFQSMSKNRAYSDAGPRASTSRHQGLVVVLIPMWFGTKSTMCWRPAARTASVNALCAASPPTSSPIALWLMTS
jgi:hypothetical protein